MKTIWKILDKMIDTLLAIGILGIVLMCLAEIIARNLFKFSIAWSGEAARYLFVFVVFIGASALTRDRDFICMDLLKDKIRTDIQYYYNLALDIILLLFAIVLIYSGYGMVQANAMQVSAAMGLPKSVIYGVMPISGCLISIYDLRNILNDTKNKFVKGEEK